MILAVNGTLMRGFELHSRLIHLGGEFVEGAVTAPEYRLWTIGDRYPGMIRDPGRGQPITLELYEISPENLVKLVEGEPPGLCLGKIKLMDGRSVLGILAEPWVVTDCLEISSWGGWREYINALS